MISDTIINNTDLFFHDKGYYFKNILQNPSEYLTWKDVETAINKPELFHTEVISKEGGGKIEMATKNYKWPGPTVDKEYVHKKFLDGNGLVITGFHFYKDSLMNLVREIETLFEGSEADTHIYCGLENAKSFTAHCDKATNFIFQIEGSTKWTIYKNKISNIVDFEKYNDFFVDIKEEELDIEIEVELQPGDGLYIPERVYHKAAPSGKRLSLSIPIVAATTDVDRNYYKI